jgi:hypothetical protein
LATAQEATVHEIQDLPLRTAVESGTNRPCPFRRLLCNRATFHPRARRTGHRRGHLYRFPSREGSSVALHYTRVVRSVMNPLTISIEAGTKTREIVSDLARWAPRVFNLHVINSLLHQISKSALPACYPALGAFCPVVSPSQSIPRLGSFRHLPHRVWASSTRGHQSGPPAGQLGSFRHFACTGGTSLHATARSSWRPSSVADTPLPIRLSIHIIAVLSQESLTTTH